MMELHQDLDIAYDAPRSSQDFELEPTHHRDGHSLGHIESQLEMYRRRELQTAAVSAATLIMNLGAIRLMNY